MAKSTATLGAGVTIGYSALPLATPAVYTKIAQLEDATPPKSQIDDVEISNHDSANRKKEWIPGWLDESNPTFTFIYGKADAATVQGFASDRVIRGWQILYPDGSSHTFTGYAKEAGIASPLKDKMTQDFSIKIDDSNKTFTPAP